MSTPLGLGMLMLLIILSPFDWGLAVLLHVLPMLAMAGRWHTTEFSLNVSAMAMAMAVPVVCLGS